MENIFNVKYNIILDRLDISKVMGKSKLFSFVKNNKFFSIIVVSFLILSGINFYLIYSFMKILEHI